MDKARQHEDQMENKETWQTIMEVVKVKQEVEQRPIKYQTRLNTAKAGIELVVDEIGDEAQEVVLLIVLNNMNEINAIHRLSKGGLSQSMIYPREVFQLALMNNGKRILLAHNHPGGNLSPSPVDITITQQIKKAGELLTVDLVDHYIVSGKKGISLRSLGIF